MPNIFRIDFFGSQTSAAKDAVFSPGQNVHARVVLQLPKPMKARSIDLCISGKAKVHWKERKQGRNRYDRRIIPYHSEEIYLNRNIQLWTSADQQQIPAGEHIFPFQFTIPPHCPPNFEGTIARHVRHPFFGTSAHIRYFCSVNIDRPWRFDKKIKSTFYVTPLIDLNTIDWVLSPVEQQIDENIGGCCCNYGNLKAKVKLPKSGFVPGEGIPITIEMDNRTTKRVKKVKAKLNQNVKYIAQREGDKYVYFDSFGDWTRTNVFGEKTSSSKIAEMEKQFSVAPRSKGTFQWHLAVPPCTPSINNCAFIHLSYFMKVKIVTTSFCCGSASVQFHLLIGTIPIQNS